jgi:hypothetical protein
MDWRGKMKNSWWLFWCGAKAAYIISWVIRQMHTWIFPPLNFFRFSKIAKLHTHTHEKILMKFFCTIKLVKSVQRIPLKFWNWKNQKFNDQKISMFRRKKI